MVYVLQAMVLTEKEKMVLTPTYYVFKMYKVHQGATLIPVELIAPEYMLDNISVPSLSASASRDKDGKLHLSIVNLDPNRAAEITAKIAGSIRNVTGEVLTAPVMNAMNTFENPTAVRTAPFSGCKVQGGQANLSIPPKSVVVLELRCDAGAKSKPRRAPQYNFRAFHGSFFQTAMAASKALVVAFQTVFDFPLQFPTT